MKAYQIALSILWTTSTTTAFTPSSFVGGGIRTTTKLYQALDTEEKTEEVTTTTPPKVKYGAGPPELTNGSNDEPEGLPWWWEYIWELPIMQVSCVLFVCYSHMILFCLYIC